MASNLVNLYMDLTAKNLPQGHRSYFIECTQFLCHVLRSRLNINKKESVIIFMALQGRKMVEALSLIALWILKE